MSVFKCFNVKFYVSALVDVIIKVYLFEVCVAVHQVNQEELPDNELTSPSQKEIQRIMSENLHGGDVQSMRILSYRTKAPSAPDVSLLKYSRSNDVFTVTIISPLKLHIGTGARM